MSSYEEAACHKGNWKRREVSFVADSFFIGFHRQKLLVPQDT
jgi:hypothetical protein